MEDARIYLKRALAKFVREQRRKKGYSLEARNNINGFTYEKLEKTASRIPCCELFAIFEEHFNKEDTNRFWFELQVGIYERKREA